LNEKIKSLTCSNTDYKHTIETTNEHRRNLEESLETQRRELEKKETKLNQQQFELEQFKVDKQVMKEEIRREFRDELKQKDLAFESLHERYMQLQKEYEKSNKNHTDELLSRERSKEDAINLVEEQVMSRLLVKDEIIQRLKRQLEDSTLKVVHLEHLMEKQRKELLET
jgi:chromosome segregation ATPase